MAINNKRKSLIGVDANDALKNKLQESFRKFQLNEAEEDDLAADLGAEAGEDDLDLDAELGGADMGGDEGMDDEGMGDGDMDNIDPIANLDDNEAEQVEAWVDELLRDSLDQAEVNGDESLDTEMSSTSLDPMGEETFVHDDLPLTSDDLENVIDSDDSISALENELANLAQDQDMIDDESTELEGTDMIDADQAEDDLEEAFGLNEWNDLEEAYELYDDEGNVAKSLPDEIKMNQDGSKVEESMDFGQNSDLEEAEDPFKGLEGLEGFDLGYEGEDFKDELQEDVELAPDNKEMGMKQVQAPLGKPTTTVTPTPGARTKEDLEADAAGMVKEAQIKSKMLVKSAGIIESLRLESVKNKEQINKLKLENYKLMKVNGLLSTSGELLSADVRTKISEGFEKCKDLAQVNKFYSQITEKIKTINRPSLNESVNNGKRKIMTINESTEEKLSNDQMRKNMLMGIKTSKDMYMN